MKLLYRYETKGIQDWILGSNKLRDLAGGSALIESLTHAAATAAGEFGAEIIQATSGAMTAVFPNRECLQHFAGEWTMQVAFRAPGLQLVQAWVEIKEGLSGLFAALAERRNQVSLLEIEANPWVLRAGQSGLPALPTPRSIRTVARNTALDQVALAKERARRDVHYQSLDVTGGRPWDAFEERLDCWPDGPIAVVHADGSGVGQRLIQTKVDALHRFSSELREASLAATEAAVASIGCDEELVHARPVVSAGDDLTYILLGRDARKFCEAWLRTWEAETEKRKAAFGGVGFNGGAGIVVLNRGYPFSRAYELAEQLCSAAKNELKRLGRAASILAIRKVTNSLVEDITEHTSGWIVSKSTESQFLDKLVQAVGSLPRGTLRTWLDHSQRENGQAVAEKLWSRAREVADSDLWSRLEEALADVGANPGDGLYTNVEPGSPAFPLGSTPNPTPLADALTLCAVEEREVVGCQS